MPKPSPVSNELSKPYWDGCNRGELLFQRCTNCSNAQFYPRSICIRCYSKALTWECSSGVGIVETFTEVHRGVATAFAEEVPYVVALIQLKEGFRLMSNIVGARDKLEIGAPVAAEFEQRERQKVPVFRVTV